MHLDPTTFIPTTSWFHHHCNRHLWHQYATFQVFIQFYFLNSLFYTFLVFQLSKCEIYSAKLLNSSNQIFQSLQSHPSLLIDLQFHPFFLQLYSKTFLLCLMHLQVGVFTYTSNIYNKISKKPNQIINLSSLKV